MTLEQQKIIEDNIKLVYYSIKLMNGNIKNIDLIEVGYIGICNGALSYDKNKGSISNYLITCICNEIKEFYKHNTTYNEIMNNNLDSLNRTITSEDGSKIELIDIIANKKDNYTEYNKEVKINNYINEIFHILQNDKYGLYIIKNYLQGKTFTDMAKERKVSEQAINDKFHRVINKLRKRLTLY